MSETNSIYYSLDEARAELSRRWNNQNLRESIEAELGPLFIQEFKQRPRAIISRPLLSPDNGFVLFYQAAHYVGSIPLSLEYRGDLFTYGNDEKRGCGELRISNNGCKGVVRIISMKASNQKSFTEVTTLTGDPLIEFHRRLMDLSGWRVEQKDMTPWFKGIGTPSNYYYPHLLHYVTHGVLFENFQTDADPKEAPFTHNVVFPAIEKIKEKFGLRPLIVRLYPENQTDDDDFYWWSYPRLVNDYIVKYAQENKLPVRELT